MTLIVKNSPTAVPEIFKKLQDCAAVLNAASDELGRAIADADAALKKLNLGISAWVELFEHKDESSGDFTDRGLGYAKVNGRWCIALRTREGCFAEGTVHSEEWPFNEAPRALRAEAVEKLPDLLTALARAADDTTADIEAKTVKAREFAAAIKTIPARQK